MYVFAVPLLNISVKHDLKGNMFILYVTDLTQCGIFIDEVFSLVFTLLYCKDTDIPVASLPESV